MPRIVRINPLREMMAMQNALDRMFEDVWRPLTTNGEVSTSYYTLPVDVTEDSQGFTVTAELPGVSHDHIEVCLEKDVLLISAEIPEPTLQENTHMVLHERRSGKFSRRLQLSQPVDENAIEATLENGVLTLTLPKVPEVQPKRIAIKSHN